MNIFHRSSSLVLSASRASKFSLSASNRFFSHVKELKSDEDYNKLSKNKSVVYFTAVWCPPCRRIAPIFNELAEENKSINFYKIDIDENKQAAKIEGIVSVPTFIFYKNEKIVNKFSGADHDQLEEFIADLNE
mmetsp:Transcript_19122/g.28202  ORF Transcript_19122/g.28202 Transcript_19122/m.28202 type:complete len:133 (+) Transcript_19122:27-425(+)